MGWKYLQEDSRVCVHATIMSPVLRMYAPAVHGMFSGAHHTLFPAARCKYLPHAAGTSAAG